nr:hypothetical protein [Tanacetum cinerariifolium]
MEHSSLCSASEDDFQNQLRRCLVELTLQKARPMRNKERVSWDLGTGSHGVLGEVIGTVKVNAGVRERVVREKGVLAGNAVAG